MGIVLRKTERLVNLRTRKHIRNAVNRINTWIRSRRSKARRTACDLRRVPMEACTTCLPHQSVRQRLEHVRCFLRTQSAEIERRKREEAGQYQLPVGTPRSSAAADNPQEYALHGAEYQAGGLSLHPQVRCDTSR